MGAILGTDANTTKTDQQVYNLQATSQSGSVTGGTAGRSIGTGSAALGNQARINTGKGGSTQISVVNTTLDRDVAIAALESQQALSTLAVGYANANATQALQSLQTLGTAQQALAAGGSPSDVIAASPFVIPSPTKKYILIAVALIAAVAIATYTYKKL